MAASARPLKSTASACFAFSVSTCNNTSVHTCTHAHARGNDGRQANQGKATTGGKQTKERRNHAKPAATNRRRQAFAPNGTVYGMTGVAKRTRPQDKAEAGMRQNNARRDKSHQRTTDTNPATRNNTRERRGKQLKGRETSKEKNTGDKQGEKHKYKRTGFMARKRIGGSVKT